jgi:hypothetical protein
MEICGIGQVAARAAAGPLSEGVSTYLLTLTIFAGLHRETLAQTLHSIQVAVMRAAFLPRLPKYWGSMTL